MLPELETAMKRQAEETLRMALRGFQQRHVENIEQLRRDLRNVGTDWHANKETVEAVAAYCGKGFGAGDRFENLALPHTLSFLRGVALNDLLAKLREVDALMRQYPQEAP